jgi:hypothetical protein
MVGGRPTKFNKDRADTIIDLVSKGNFKTTAARAAGVAPYTLQRWIDAGREGKNKALREFCVALDKAEADAELNAVSKINTKMNDSSIPALLDYMRRRFPDWNVADKKESTVTYVNKNEEVIDLRLENLLARYNTRGRKVLKNGSGESVDTDTTAR